MAIISKVDMMNIAELLGNSYQRILDSYGTVNTSNTAAFDAARAKSYVRGGAEADNGIRASRVSSGGTVLDLLPVYNTVDSTTIYLRHGKFYINDVEKELSNDIMISTDPLLSNPLAAGLYTGEQLTSGASPLNIQIGADSFIKGFIYLTEDPINNNFDINDWSDNNEFFVINDIKNGTGTWSIAQIISAAQDGIAVDEIKLFLKKTGSPLCNLKIDIYVDNDGIPDTSSVAKGESIFVSSAEISESGSWVSFPLIQRIILTDSDGTVDYWIVLSTSVPNTGDLIINNNNYIIWCGNSSTTTVVPTETFTLGNYDYRSIITNTGPWTALNTPEETTSAAHRLINYVRASWTYYPDFTGFPRFNMEKWISLDIPENSHVNIAEITLKTDNMGNILNINNVDDDYSSYLNDMRSIVGYEGLEDDDQMGNLFEPINETEDSILTIPAETRTSTVVSHYSSAINGLNAHITSNISGSTFKSYWKGVGANFPRSFRKLWYLNQNNTELSVIFGTKTNTGELKTFADITNNWKYNNTYCANVTIGGDLELIIPEAGKTWETEDNLIIYAIRPVWTTIADNINIGNNFIKLNELPATFLTAAQTGPIYVWVEKWDAESGGELLYINTFTDTDTCTNGILASSDATDGPAVFNHTIGDRIYLVDELIVTVAETLSETVAQAITPSATGIKYIGCAYINSASAIEGNVAVRLV